MMRAYRKPPKDQQFAELFLWANSALHAVVVVVTSLWGAGTLMCASHPMAALLIFALGILALGGILIVTLAGIYSVRVIFTVHERINARLNK